MSSTPIASLHPCKIPISSKSYPSHNCYLCLIRSHHLHTGVTEDATLAMLLLLVNILMQGLFIGFLEACTDPLIDHSHTPKARVTNNTMTLTWHFAIFCNSVPNFHLDILNLPKSIGVFEAWSHERRSDEILASGAICAMQWQETIYGICAMQRKHMETI